MSSYFRKDGSPNFGVVRRPAKKKTKALAKKLRQNMTSAERLMWTKLHALNLRFRRQVVVLGWIADFYHPQSRTVIEIDGGYHLSNEQSKRDLHRDAVMTRHGFKVLRFVNEDVFKKTSFVVNSILEAANLAIPDKPGTDGRKTEPTPAEAGSLRRHAGNPNPTSPATVAISQERT